MKKASLLLLFGITAIVFSCKKETSAPSSDGIVYLDVPVNGGDYFGQQANEQNHKATLGRVLFYDKSLSLNNATACASCHKQQFAFSDNVAQSRGFENRLTGRNSMAIQNLSSGFRTNPFVITVGSFFWDGRENSLQNLVARPITNHIEMGIDDLNTLPQKLSGKEYYRELFTKAYGTEEITMDKIGECVSLFMNAITANNTKFDQHFEGQYDLTALEAEGQRLFNTKYECNGCHKLFVGGYSGNEFMNIGLEKRNNDLGAGPVVKNPAMNGKFKIPNLRNVAQTAPYMHDGRFATLDAVLDHYSHGILNDQNLDERLKDKNGKPLSMNISTDERKAIIAFLNTLTDYSMLTAEKYASPFKMK